MSTITTSFSRTNHSYRAWWNTLSFIILLILCVGYIYQINKTVSKGYQIRELESTISEFTLRNQKLEIVTQQAQSLENIERATKMLGLVRADQPIYVQSSGASYVLNK